MAVDPDEGLVTDFMLGLMIAFGVDIIIFVGIGWGVGFFTTAFFVGVTVMVVSVFALWIAWRWRAINKLESTDRDAVDELKYQYATGEISEGEFERKLNTLIDTPEADEREFADVESPTESSK